MKSLTFAAGIATLTTSLSTTTVPASAQVMAIGGSFAQGCYRAAAEPLATLEMVTTCNRALDRESLSPDDQFATYVNRGILKMIRGDFSAAQKDFDDAVEMNPKRPEGWLNMAILRFKQGESAAALPLFDRSIALGTKVPEIAYYGRGLAHEDVGDLQAAYEDLRRAVSLRPGWADPAQDLARYQVRSR
jgi:tetratricopeptide (TPR) repeat protein